MRGDVLVRIAADFRDQCVLVFRTATSEAFLDDIGREFMLRETQHIPFDLQNAPMIIVLHSFNELLPDARSDRDPRARHVR